jgi:N-acetylmuramoyl-L-alanine amidase
MALYDIDYVVKNKFSRPGYKLLDVLGIIIHWTANPGASDENHESFFDGEDGGGSRYAGAHMFVDKDSATLIIPEDEIAYQANESKCRIAKLKGSIKRADGSTYYGDANVTTLSLELCVEKDGTIHPDTIIRASKIVAEWCKKYKLTVNDVHRHYDVTGKNCPRPWVENPQLFTNFKRDVQTLLAPKKPEPVTSPPQSTWQILKVIKSEFGIYSEPKTKWKEDSEKYVGWIFVAKNKQLIEGQWWFELFIGDTSYGWISRSQVDGVDYTWATLNDDTIGYVHSDMKAKIGVMHEGGRVAIIGEYTDKYLIISSNKPQWIYKANIL